MLHFIKKLLSRNKNQKQGLTVYYRMMCQDCDRVKKYLDDNKIAYNYLDCEDENSHPPIPIMAAPALFINNELVAYGVDIIDYVQKIK